MDGNVNFLLQFEYVRDCRAILRAMRYGWLAMTQFYVIISVPPSKYGRRRCRR